MLLCSMVPTMNKLLLLLLLVLPLAASAETSFVKLPMGHEIYVDHQAAKGDKATFVLVNGLVYDFSRWNELAAKLESQGFGVVRYYFRGQQKTLRRELEKGSPAFFRDGLSQANYAQELSELLKQLKIEKGVIVGLSYGAGIAAEFAERYPQQVEQLTFLAPLVVSLDRYDPNGAWIQMNLAAMKIFWGPFWGQWAYDQYYDWIYRKYMAERLGNDRIPAEMQDVAGTYKETVFHQVRAMRDFDLRGYRFKDLAGRVNVILASGESEPALKDQFRAWSNFGAAQGSLIYLSPSFHAIPDSQGAWAAELLAGLTTKDARLTRGQAYYSKPASSWAGLEKASTNDLEGRALKEPRDGDQAAAKKGVSP
ncbi:MAG: alpha/beta fold hydrolase [Proteobacteria bacterium]|nr:MAG: alpha/beta fold hydrolase [Pseudomonadota bacterium]